VVVGFAAGVVIAVLTAPVGVSGAVFLLPVQLDVLRVPSPAVTPTNLLFNIVATPGALLRYRSQGQWGDPLVGQLVRATLPGVVFGALIRVYLVPGVQLFRLVGAAVLPPLGLWLWWRDPARQAEPAKGSLSARTISGLALLVGVVGGVYGIGGGSLLGPILVSAGYPVAVMAPAALTSTFVTSLAGVATYAVLALTSTEPIAPHWILGLTCGLGGGLLGGYLGARLQPKLPEKALRRLLAATAVGLALTHLRGAGATLRITAWSALAGGAFGISSMTLVDLMTATASEPGANSSSRTASVLISDTIRYGPHCISTCAITVSATTEVTSPTS